MPVYEATNPLHYKKIANFISSQPSDSLPSICWHKGFGQEGHFAETIRWFKERMPFLHIFWCEDSNGNVKAVLSVHERMSEQNVPVATCAFVCIDYKDWENNEGKYFKELLDYIIRNEAPKHHLIKGEFFGLEKYANWTKELCGESIEILGKELTDLGMIYAYTIDFKKYAGI